ncbi:hypothetical protein [Flavicella sediminum]|uniref:hypothetical protein n=1 Tax=Flavicella sediminum TaxID=2585141 RepID=UPI00111E1DA0|nr:hypothetical protein [Flavicella sediminum]
MKKIMTILVLSMSLTLTAQGTYEKGMQKAFGFWSSGKTTEAANLFERISSAEKNNWLPLYYAAQVRVLSSFGLKDETVITANLKAAQKNIDQAFEISNNNAELLVLQALLHTVWVAFDGATYGPKLSGTVYGLYAKAHKIAPNNPRVVYAKAEWEMGGAKFFGKDITPFCKDIQRSLELFATFELETPFHPNWGKERAEQIANDCK